MNVKKIGWQKKMTKRRRRKVDSVPGALNDDDGDGDDDDVYIGQIRK